MTTQIITLTDSDKLQPDPTSIFFKTSLVASALAVDPQTVITIAKMAKDLYDILKKSKEKKKEDVGEWLEALDRKLSQILSELAQIKEGLKKIEELITLIPYLLAENNLDKNIKYYYLNIFDFKANPDDISIRTQFRGLYSDLQKDMLTITEKSAYFHLYDIILAFIVQFDIACGLGNSKSSKLALIELTLAFLEKARNPMNTGSFGQVLQIHLNSKLKLTQDFQSYNGILRKFCILERKQTGGGGSHLGGPEPKEYGWRIARLTYSYSIEGNINNGFSLSMKDEGLSEERWVYGPYDYEETKNLTNQQDTRQRITSEINGIHDRYTNARAQCVEIDKNIIYYQGIVENITNYINLLDELTTDIKEK